jgi:hypothetical protein
LRVPNLPKGWYIVALDAPFPTRYGYQLGGGDPDQDAIPGLIDNCPVKVNPFQTDTDGDRYGDVCDSCPVHFDPTQADSNRDGLGDRCEKEGPIPAVTLNGVAHRLYLAPGEPLTAKVSCYAGTGAGETVDWGFVAATPFGPYTLTLGGSGQINNLAAQWVPGLQVSYQGPLADLPPVQAVSLPQGGLQPGDYVLFFGLDTKGNGQVDLDAIRFDALPFRVMHEQLPPYEREPEPEVGFNCTPAGPCE